MAEQANGSRCNTQLHQACCGNAWTYQDTLTAIATSARQSSKQSATHASVLSVYEQAIRAGSSHTHHVPLDTPLLSNSASLIALKRKSQIADRHSHTNNDARPLPLSLHPVRKLYRRPAQYSRSSPRTQAYPRRHRRQRSSRSLCHRPLWKQYARRAV
jgi:hypothetical protein